MRTHENTIVFDEQPIPSKLKFYCSALYNLSEVKGYKDIILDFSNVHTLFPNFMLPFVALCRKHRLKKVDFSIIFPKDEKIKSLFHNTNWSHLINENYQESNYRNGLHVPAISFQDADNQYEAVDKIIFTILRQSENLTRKSLKALEWSINEITDNVLNHSESSLGGLVQASVYTSSNHVEFVVSDAGIGIAQSLKMKNHHDALEFAIREGGTRDKKTNQGNGLFGSYRVAALSGGTFELISGRACAQVNGIDNVNFIRDNSNAFFEGTSVSAKIDCSKSEIIEEALRFGGKTHIPCNDYIEQHYAGEEDNTYNFLMKTECPSFGSRDYGKAEFNKIIQIISEDKKSKLNIDFDEVAIISSSFADEVFGRLFIHLGPMDFMSRIRFINIDETISGLIDRAIKQRFANSE